MAETGTAAEHLPARLSLRALRDAAEDRKACPLWRTGTRTVFGERGVRVTKDRGRPLESELAAVAFATVHPSSILRAPDEASRRQERALFVDDLRVAGGALRS